MVSRRSRGPALLVAAAALALAAGCSSGGSAAAPPPVEQQNLGKNRTGGIASLAGRDGSSG